MSQDLTASPSVLDTKETFRHFSGETAGSDSNKSAFFKSLYRYLNLRLADVLESTSLGDHEDVYKVIKSLRCCSTVSLVEVDERSNARVITGSKKCRSKFCYICNRQKSKKLTQRLIHAMSDDLSVFDGYRYYFLTLTLKHDEKTRNYDYLSELKDYQNKLFKSKKFRAIFSSQNGIIQAFENSMVKGMHIHSHNMIFAPRLTIPAAEAEQKIRDIWKRLTKDSVQIRLDLIGKGFGDDDSKMTKSVIELFKYSTKMSFKKKDSAARNERLAEWVVSSKHKNFINARGIFRGLQLTGHESRLDLPYVPDSYDIEKEHYLAKTVHLQFNHSHFREYSVTERSKILETVYLKYFDNRFLVSALSHDIDGLLHMSLGERGYRDVMDNLDRFELLVDSGDSVGDSPNTDLQGVLFDRFNNLLDNY